jgi:hypothetical protein
LAFVAVTVNVDGLPEVIEAGLAVMLTVGAVFVEPTLIAPPHPVTSRASGRLRKSTAEKKVG